MAGTYLGIFDSRTRTFNFDVFVDRCVVAKFDLSESEFVRVGYACADQAVRNRAQKIIAEFEKFFSEYDVNAIGSD